MALKQILIALGALLFVAGTVDFLRDGAFGGWAIAIAAVLIAFATRGDALKNNGADNAR